MLDPYLNLAALQINRLRDRAELKPAIQSFFDDATNTASYVVHDAPTRRAAIIDSVLVSHPPAARTQPYARGLGVRDWRRRRYGLPLIYARFRYGGGGFSRRRRTPTLWFNSPASVTSGRDAVVPLP